MTDWTATSASGALAQAALAAVLAASATAKARPGKGLAPTLIALGLWLDAARIAAPLVVVAEATAAAGLIATPHQLWPRVLTAVLAAGFALAGVRALTLPGAIHCGCFGGAGKSPLGRRQIALLPLWLAACALAQAGHPHWSAAQGLAGLSFFLLALSAVTVARAVALWRDLRYDRIALHN